MDLELQLYCQTTTHKIKNASTMLLSTLLEECESIHLLKFYSAIPRLYNSDILHRNWPFLTLENFLLIYVLKLHFYLICSSVYIWHGSYSWIECIIRRSKLVGELASTAIVPLAVFFLYCVSAGWRPFLAVQQRSNEYQIWYESSSGTIVCESSSFSLLSLHGDFCSHIVLFFPIFSLLKQSLSPFFSIYLQLQKFKQT